MAARFYPHRMSRERNSVATRCLRVRPRFSEAIIYTQKRSRSGAVYAQPIALCASSAKSEIRNAPGVSWWRMPFIRAGMIDAISSPGRVKSACNSFLISKLRDLLAEREGFEPPIAFRLCLISSQVHSTGLCHLSALFFKCLAQEARCCSDRNTYHDSLAPSRVPCCQLPH
jgi:hypothetical protein